MQWEKCRNKPDIEKTFSDTAQYFHSKHLKNGPKRHEKHFFQWNGILRPKRYFPKFIASCSFMPTSPNFEVHYVRPKMFVFIHKQILLRSFEWLSLQILHVWAKTPDWPLWPKSSEKKEDFEIKSDLFWQNPFLKLWKLKFIIIQFGSIRFWSIFYVFLCKIQGV